ncbi:MAG: MarR family winged helix-turn-helix transcriptional regulator [Candidatus Acidiferrales bacterium]
MGRKIDYRALADFRYEIRRYLNFSARAARAAGLEPQQHQALLAIKGLGDESRATVGWLAGRLDIRHHSAVELGDRLEARGLVRRTRGGADRRKVLLQLTRAGEGLLRELSAPHRRELRTAGPRLVEALRAAMVHGARARGGTKRRRRNK